MAYDAHAAYEPPRRAYYGNGGYAAQEQSYDAGYEQVYDQGQYRGQNGYGQDMNQYQQQYEGNGMAQHSQEGRHDQYYGGYEQQQSRGQQQYERSYDPRFQRGGGSKPPQNGYGSQSDQRQKQERQRPDRQEHGMQPHSRDEYAHQNGQERRQDQHAYPHDQQLRTEPRSAQPRHGHDQQPHYDQRNGHSQSGVQQRQQDPRNAHPPPMRQYGTVDMTSPPRVQVNNAAISSRPTAPIVQSGPKKLSMEEWKAQEKARMKAAATSPDVMAQDNAFPTFPNTKKPGLKPDSRPGGSAMSQRTSEETPRPSTSSSRPSREQQRPSMSCGNSYNHEMPPPVLDGQPRAQSRPATADSKPYASEPVEHRPNEKRPSPPQSQPLQRPPYETAPSSHRQTTAQHMNMNHTRADHEWPMQSQPSLHVQPTVQQDQSRGRPSQDHYQDRPLPQRQQYSVPYADQRRPNTSGGQAPIQPINISQAQQQHQMPAYMDHQPLSPAYVPERPSTTQGTRSAFSPPPSATPSSRHPNGTNANQAFQPQPKPYIQQSHNKQQSLGDLYDDYRAPEPVIAGPAAPVSREQEIEAEMPDFDSAAPQQTSMLHKRNKTVDKHLAEEPAESPPPMPTQQSSQSVPSLHDPTSGGGQGYIDPMRDMAQRKHRYAQNGSFDSVGPQQYSQNPQQERGQMRSGQRQYSGSMPYQDGNLSVQPPNPPFANAAPPRRSTDDARHMPYRQGPPQPQRFNSNGQPVRSANTPLSRPDMERNMSGATMQSTRSEPAVHRVGSAPPTRPPFQEQPGPPGIPLAQQRSAPEQPLGSPDALPQHPVPVRPGLMESGTPQAVKPPPVRNYAGGSSASAPAQSRGPPVEVSRPVTHAELEKLRAEVNANPNSLSKSLLLAKKLAEAASVLASEGGKADARTTAKNRERYIVEAHKRVKKLVAAGYPDAQFYLADCYGQGLLGLEVDTKDAFNLYQAAAKAGHAQAAYRTAVCCEIGAEEGGGTRKDYAKANQWYRRAAALGDVAAMFKVGMISLKGLLGEKRNVGDALTWLKRAAERADREHPHALHELGTLHEAPSLDLEIRSKVVVDEAYALDHFQRAAGYGYKFSQFRLGVAYEYGNLGLKIDHRASISWYSKAAAQGEHNSELALSGWYLTGAEGILEHNETEAYLWARKAASSEPPLAKAMFAMGYFSELGIGCPANMEEARKWYGRAASYKFPKAFERLEELKRSGKQKPAPVNGKLARKDQKRDEAECVVM